MAFGAKKIFPIDTKPGTGVGVAIPFNAPGVFKTTYTTKEAVKNNLINVISSLNIRKVSSLPAAPYVLKILKGIKHLKY